MIFMLPSRMFFDDMLSDFEKENKMKCDIFEKDNKVFIEMDVPGYDKKDIKVEFNNYIQPFIYNSLINSIP